MSEENVEIVNQAWEALFRGDLDGLAAIWDPEVVWELTHFREWPEPAYRGIDGVKRFLTEWAEVWDDWEFGARETLATPDGRVISLAWQRGKGRESGLAMEIEWAQIFTLRDGKITRIDNYDDRDDALEAAGLQE